MPQLTWPMVFDRWAGHHVPMVQVHLREDGPRYWGETAWRERTAGGLKPYGGALSPNPLRDTARAIATGRVTTSEETYAGFCLLAFIRNYPSPTDDDLAMVLSGRFREPGGCAIDYWNANARA